MGVTKQLRRCSGRCSALDIGFAGIVYTRIYLHVINIHLFKLLYTCLYLVYTIISLVYVYLALYLVYLGLYLVYLHIYQVYDRSFPHALSYGGAFPHALSYGRISHMSVVISLSYTSIGKHCCNRFPLHTLLDTAIILDTSIWSSQVRISGCQDSCGMCQILTYT